MHAWAMQPGLRVWTPTNIGLSSARLHRRGGQQNAAQHTPHVLSCLKRWAENNAPMPRPQLIDSRKHGWRMNEWAEWRYSCFEEDTDARNTSQNVALG